MSPIRKTFLPKGEEIFANKDLSSVTRTFDIPTDGKIQILYTVQYCGESNWTRESRRPLSSAGNNWIGFSNSKNVCQFKYGFYKSSGEAIDVQFEMNYYLNY